MSAPEPGPSERVSFTGRCGQVWASAEVALARAIVKKATKVQKAANVPKGMRAIRFIVPTIPPRGTNDGNYKSWNSRPRKDGRAHGAPPSCQGLQRRRLR